ncbi:MAG: hypothetical protein IJD73_02095, partial [Clostridia bacterium]|nr:hypothetical protein [Clostridia bacterium]
MPTAKLDVCDIKIVTVYPDKIKSKTLNREHVSVERTFFENSQKPFCKKVFCGAFFQKSDIKPLTQTNFYPHIAFSFGTKRRKRKSFAKRKRRFYGALP